MGRLVFMAEDVGTDYDYNGSDSFNSTDYMQEKGEIRKPCDMQKVKDQGNYK